MDSHPALQTVLWQGVSKASTVALMSCSLRTLFGYIARRNSSEKSVRECIRWRECSRFWKLAAIVEPEEAWTVTRISRKEHASLALLPQRTRRHIMRKSDKLGVCRLPCAQQSPNRSLAFLFREAQHFLYVRNYHFCKRADAFYHWLRCSVM